MLRLLALICGNGGSRVIVWSTLSKDCRDLLHLLLFRGTKWRESDNGQNGVKKGDESQVEWKTYSVAKDFEAKNLFATVRIEGDKERLDRIEMMCQRGLELLLLLLLDIEDHKSRYVVMVRWGR